MIAHSESGILLTSYDQLRLQRNLLLGVSWGYAVLDEGHKIRNPDAEARPARLLGTGLGNPWAIAGATPFWTRATISATPTARSALPDNFQQLRVRVRLPLPYGALWRNSASSAADEKGHKG